nr:hypothetical protein [Tanacetum cinerariifolium]
MRFKESATWVWEQVHMRRSGEGFGTVQKYWGVREVLYKGDGNWREKRLGTVGGCYGFGAWAEKALGVWHFLHPALVLPDPDLILVFILVFKLPGFG